MKKIFKSLAFALAFALSFGTAACSDVSNAGKNGKFDYLSTTESVYGFCAASAGMLISSVNDDFAASDGDGTGFPLNASDGLPANVAPFVTASTAATDTENVDTAELDKYMALVESLLSDGGFYIDSDASDREGYEIKTVFSYSDMQGNDLSCVMYYNRTLTKTERENENETEENYAIDGIMSIDGKDYPLRGERTDETDGDENESETIFEVELDAARSLTVKQSFETEDDETELEYSYSLYESGTLIERSTFSYETEQNETELKMTSFRDGKTQVLYFEKEVRKEKDVILISVGDGKKGSGYVVKIVQDENGGNRYVYEPADFDD